MESFYEPLKTALCRLTTYRTVSLLCFCSLISFGAVASTCPPNTPLYRYVPTKLESIVGDQPVLSFTRDVHGNTWIATQSGPLCVTVVAPFFESDTEGGRSNDHGFLQPRIERPSGA